MVGTGQLTHIARRFRHQLHAPVLADIVKGAYRVVIPARAQDQLTPKTGRDIVALLGQLAFKPSNLPRACPDLVPFAVHEVFGIIALRRDRGTAQFRLGLL